MFVENVAPSLHIEFVHFPFLAVVTLDTAAKRFRRGNLIYQK